MGMNKKEQAEMQALRDEVIRLKAWRLTDTVEPDVPIPDSFSKLSTGFMHIGCGWDIRWARVELACSSSIHHAVGRDDKTTTQQPMALYSTRTRAWQAMRNEVEQKALKALSWIDAQIAKEVEAGK